MNHRPVCSKCTVEMRPVRNDIVVVDYAWKPPQPYQLWSADEWGCPECGHRVALGFGVAPFSRHYEEGFQSLLERLTTSQIRNNYEYTGESSGS